MTDRVLALILDEGKWLTASMGLALLSVCILLYRHRHSAVPSRRRIIASMNLFFGATIGSMAFGHLLAVTTKLVLGTLEGSIPLFYGIGVVLAVPSWWLLYHAPRLLLPDAGRDRTTLFLNAGLAFALLALGLPNVPLAVPAAFNVG